ncbi:MAG: M1 family metallopeptidase [Gemmatimonadaceae bacterium]
MLLKSAYIACAIVSAFALESAAQSKTGGSRPGIDVLHYDFQLQVPLFYRAIEGEATIKFRRTARVDTLVLDLVGMKADQIRVNGIAAQSVQTDSTLRLTLPAGSGDTLTVSLRFSGEPKDGLIFSTDTTGRFQAFGDNFPNRGRFWLPTVDHPADKATVNWTVIAPSDRRVIANGALIEERPLLGMPARTMTRYETSRPIATYLMVIGVAPFATVDLGESACGLAEKSSCVRQSVWASPEVRDYLPGPFAKAGAIVDYFSKLVGPFPYEKLAHVQSATRYGGMENASAIFYADNLFKRRTLTEGLIAHETAHQWFGDAVTESEWPHVWLSEGFATYFSALWTEHAYGDSAFRADLTRMRSGAIGNTIAVEKAVVDTTLSDVSKVLNSNVYPKAGFTLHMLRREIGDSAFFRGIRAYYAKYRHKNALTQDLMHEFESASGQSLGWFFGQWFWRAGFAELTIGWRYDSAKQRVILDVEQGARFAPYRVRMAVDIVDSAGDVRRASVTIPAEPHSVVEVPLSAPAAPSRIVLDADVGVLGTITRK